MSVTPAPSESFDAGNVTQPRHSFGCLQQKVVCCCSGLSPPGKLGVLMGNKRKEGNEDGSSEWQPTIKSSLPLLPAAKAEPPLPLSTIVGQPQTFANAGGGSSHGMSLTPKLGWQSGPASSSGVKQ